MTLGVVAVAATLVGDWLVWHEFVAELHRLARRGTLRTLDALPALWWAALVLALLWAAVLIAIATWSVRREESPGAAAVGDGPRSGGVVGRLAAILLAVTAMSAMSATTPACAATPAVSVSVAATTGTHAGVDAGTDAEPAAKANASDPCAQDVPTPGWVPDKPARTDQVARECAPLVTGRPVADDSGEVVVHRGDTLWSIAAAHLGPHADAQAIAAEWPRWYAANRQVIGDNPDLLFIGTRLRMPDHALEGSGLR